MLVEISHGSVSFGAEVILSDINFIIKNTEEIAIVGRNGCGKTTLLNLISGRIELDKKDSGQDVFIARRGGLTVGYLQQNAFEDDSVTLEEEIKKGFQKIMDVKLRLDELLACMEKDATEEIVQEYVDLQERFQNMGGYEYEKEYELIVQKFGFAEEDKQKNCLNFPADSVPGLLLPRCCSVSRMYFCLTSRRTIWILQRSGGWNNILKHMTGRLWWFPMTGYFWKS